MKTRVAVMHGVNLDQLGGRDPEHYGSFTLAELEVKVRRWAHELGLETIFFQTNHEGEFVEYLHRLPETADGAILNPGSWTHYSWAIRDALEFTGAPRRRGPHLRRRLARGVAPPLGLRGPRRRPRRRQGRRGLQGGARDPRRRVQEVSDASHAERLAEAVAEAELDLLIVGDLVTPSDSSREAQANVFWPAGFGGTSGFCLVGPERRLFLTDFRYADRAAAEVGDGFDHELLEGELAKDLAKRIEGRVGFDDAHTSVAGLRKLAEAVADGVELVPSAGIVERLRRRKDAAELERIAEAARLADEVYEWIAESGRRRAQRARDPARRRAAHARARGAGPGLSGDRRRRALERACPITSPPAREIGAGRAAPDRHGRDRRRLLLRLHPDLRRRRARGGGAGGLRAGRGAQAAGARGDRARGRRPRRGRRRARADRGRRPWRRFGHGLGHGVGIEVHEAPRASKRSDDVLAEGDVVTVEPGVYLPGRFGVRIEDLVALTDDGVRNLSGVGKELRTLE